MKEKDERFLEELMRNPRATDEALAERLNLSRSGVAKRRKKLEKNGDVCYYISPNLEKEANALTTGVFKLSPLISFKSAKAAAERLARHDKIMGVWMRRIDQDKWGIGFMHYDPKIKTQLEKEKLFEELKTQIHEWFGHGVTYDLSGSTYVIKMLGKEFEGKWFE